VTTRATSVHAGNGAGDETMATLEPAGPAAVASVVATRSPYSWKASIGLIVPSGNTSLEPEFMRMAPDGVAIYTSRVRQSGPQGKASYERMSDDVEAAAGLLSTAAVDVAVFGCTVCTYYVPADEIRRTIGRVLGCETVFPAEAAVAALRALGVERVALAGPRSEELTTREAEAVVAEGLDVVGVACLGIGTAQGGPSAIGRVPPEATYRLARAADRPEAQAIFLSCTQMPSLDMIERLEALLGKPVVTSNQASLWQSLRVLGVREPVDGFGALLRTA
jgi:arylmalonate decarboxylase